MKKRQNNNKQENCKINFVRSIFYSIIFADVLFLKLLTTINDKNDKLIYVQLEN